FGAADGVAQGGRLHEEMRTLNHRHIHVQLRLPPTLQHLEAELRDLLRQRLERGHISLSARWLTEPPRPPLVRVNLERAREIVGALRELKTALALTGEIDLSFVARQPDVLVTSEEPGTAAELREIAPIVTAAVAAVLAMREREGAGLAAELQRRLDLMAGLVAQVEQRAPLRLAAERDRLRRSVGELLDGRQLDEGRLAQEIALLADRLDVTEELLRLTSHIGACGGALAAAEPVGRQLGFLGQEMLREINTIGSKANDAEIAHAVMAMKGELEKFREQVENVE
ncbi:MAG: YicC family protein, partial [Gemmatimonadetes bacterium]|nr:YicC family protein [Gemmatimonadota bacterium]